MPSFNFTNQNRMFISFHADVTTEQVAEALKKLKLEDEPIVKICRTMTVHDDMSDFHITPKNLSLEERVRRLEKRI